MKRRRLMPWFEIGLAIIACSAIVALNTHAASTQSPLPSRSFTFTYEARVTALPDHVNEMQIWVPLARTRDGQEILDRQIRTTFPYEIHQDPDYGNEMLHMQLTAPLPAQMELAIDYDVVVHGQHVRPEHPSPGETVEPMTRNLEPDRQILLDDTIHRMSQEATAGRTQPLERARGIYDYVIDFMTYDKIIPGWGRGNAQRACLLAAGNCTDFHSLFIGMARVAGIPARFKIGATIPPGPGGDIGGYHCWAEFHTQEMGWVPIDASEAWKDPAQREYYFGTLDPNKFLLSVGRDMQLVPAHQGAPVNIWFYPYVELDGQPFDGVETHFRYQALQQQEASI